MTAIRHVPALGRRASARPARPGRRAETPVARLVAAFSAWRRRRRARAALDQLSPRELADVGLSRTDIGTYEMFEDRR